jgi:alpha-glucoside transport system permease protein
MKAFDTVQAATGGNFGTTTVASEFAKKFFVQDRDGVASALAVILFLLCFPIVIWNRRVQAHVEATN